MIDDRDRRILGRLRRQGIGESKSGRGRVFRRLVDEEDSAHGAFIMEGSAQFLIKRMTRDQRAKRTLASNFLQTHARSISVHGDIAGAGFHDSKDAGDCGWRFVQIDPNPIARHHTIGDQGMSDLIAEPLQFT